MELPVIAFIQSRLAESDQELDTRKGSGFYDLFIIPQQLMLQPLLTAMETVLIGQSVRRILALDDPDAFDEESVDDLSSNLYVDRSTGDFARTTVRAFYEAPVDREFPAFSAEFTSDGLSFFNEFDFAITREQMTLQTAGNFYYFDIPVRAQTEGTSFTVAAGEITSFVNDAEAVSVTSLSDAVGGLDRETNTTLLNRTRNSIAVRDLETIKGINAILSEKFPFLSEIQAIGMGDAEMMRDILYNAHVGGKTDIYLKTPALQTLSTLVKGIGFDDTREVRRNQHRQLINSTGSELLDPSDPLASLGDPFIVVGSVVVKEDIIETAAEFVTASVPAGVGIDLSAGEWISLEVAPGVTQDIKVSGAAPNATQRFEIINIINSVTGQLLATAFGLDQIKIRSQLVGAGSVLRLNEPTSPRTDGTLILVPSALAAGYVAGVTPAVFAGDAAQVYLEGLDYSVTYDSGLIVQDPASTILSGRTLITAANGVVTLALDTFDVPSPPNAFQDVKPGDSLFITSINPATGVVVGEYIITEKVTDTQLKIQNKYGLITGPTATDSAVSFYVRSNQVVVIEYLFNPLSVDVGPLVLLADGFTRGIRPGRDDFTIKDVAFIDIISVEEIDPDTEEGLGIFLVPSGGYGSGGYGEGGYGGSIGGEYELVVNKPHERFSAFEDSMILFTQSLFGKSYRITYYAAPEILDIHNICRNDLERVTGADVLPKNFVPAFVDIEIGVRRDATNLLTPDNAGLAALLAEKVHSVTSSQGLQSSDISKILEDQGVDSVKVPFTMRAEVIHANGSTSILESQDILLQDSPPLPRETDDPLSARVSHFYPRTIVVTDVA